MLFHVAVSPSLLTHLLPASIARLAAFPHVLEPLCVSWLHRLPTTRFVSFRFVSPCVALRRPVGALHSRSVFSRHLLYQFLSIGATAPFRLVADPPCNR
jgi:hypothetical protein